MSVQALEQRLEIWQGILSLSGDASSVHLKNPFQIWRNDETENFRLCSANGRYFIELQLYTHHPPPIWKWKNDKKEVVVGYMKGYCSTRALGQGTSQCTLTVSRHSWCPAQSKWLSPEGRSCHVKITAAIVQSQLKQQWSTMGIKTFLSKRWMWDSLLFHIAESGRGFFCYFHQFLGIYRY